MTESPSPPTDGQSPIERPVDSYGLVFPDPWTGFPVDTNEQRRAIDQAKSELRTVEGWTKAHERRLDVNVARANAAMDAINATFGAAYFDLWPADDDGEPLLVSANCAVGSFGRSDVGSDLPLTAASLLIAVANRPDDGGDVDPAIQALASRVLGTTDLEPPAIVELPAGPAVRIRRHQFIRTDIATATGVYTETYLVPHSDAGERVCVLGFGTTNDKLAGDFSALFEKIAETLVLYREGEPTLPTDGDHSETTA